MKKFVTITAVLALAAVTGWASAQTTAVRPVQLPKAGSIVVSIDQVGVLTGRINSLEAQLKAMETRLQAMESSNQIQGGAILELTIAKNNANTSIGILTQKTSVLSQTTDNLSLQTDQLSQKFGTHTHAYASNRYFFAQYQCVNDAIVGAPDVYVPCSHMNSKDESTKQTSPPS